MSRLHVIWDWNGTLLDDFAITASITINALAELGHPGVTPDTLRMHYRRPLSDYFSSVIGRSALDEELHHLGQSYERIYAEVMLSQPLANDALHALDRIGARGDQSLLSMAPHEQIEQLVGHHGLAHHFTHVRGFSGNGHPSKRDSLELHCRDIGVDECDCWLIGDTVDDFDAADSLGIRTALVTTGAQARDALLSTGSPVFDSLSATVDHILQDK